MEKNWNITGEMFSRIKIHFFQSLESVFYSFSLATEKRRDRSVCIIVYFLFLNSIRLSKVVTYSNPDSTSLLASSIDLAAALVFWFKIDQLIVD